MARSQMHRIGLVLAFIIAVSAEDICSNPPPRNAHIGCCDLPKWGDSNFADTCNNTQNMICFAECVLNAIMTDNQLNIENLKSLLDAELKTDPDYIPIAIEAFAKCVPLVKQRMANKPELTVDGCSLIPTKIVECTNRLMFVNCPPSKVKSGPNCDTVRSYYEKCPFRYMTVKN